MNLFKLTRILTCNWHLISYTVMALVWRDAEKSKPCVNVVDYSPWPIQLVFLSLSFLFGLFYFDSLYVYFSLSLLQKFYTLYQVNSYSKIISMHNEFCVVSWALRGSYNDFIHHWLIDWLIHSTNIYYVPTTC